MIASLIKKYWYIIVIILLALALYATITKLGSVIKDNERLKDNFEQISTDANTKVLEYTKKELKDHYIKNDSLLRYLLDSLKVKYSKIERVVKHEYYYNYDTTIHTVQIDGNPYVSTFEHAFDNCVSVKGSIDCEKKTIKFDSLLVNYTATSLYYWKREKKFWFIRYGRRKHYAVTQNNCDGSTTVKDISIVKEK